MNKARRDLAEWCASIDEAIKPAELAGESLQGITALRQSAEKQELFVLVVGGFSAGKSSFLNKIIGRNVLPTAVTPETSLAMELHYSTDERIEAVKAGGGIERFSVDHIGKIAEDAEKYSYARLYLDNTQLRDLDPLVLVDMPGFDSPVDAHNKAIMEYLERGAHYIVLASVQEGIVSKSLGRRIREIRGLGRDFDFYLTKSDLLPPNQIEQLVSHFGEDLQENYEYTGEVTAISQSSPDAAVKLLKAIDANSVFFNLSRGSVQGVSDGLLDAVNIKISSLKNDDAKLNFAVAELESALKKLQAKSEEEAGSLSRRYGGTKVVNDVLADVSKALESSLGELVSVAKGGDSAATERCLLDIVRAELSISVTNHLGKVNREIISDLSGSLSGLDKVMKDLEVSDDFTKKLSDAIGSQLSQLLAAGTKTAGGAVVGKVLGSVAVSAGSKVLGIGLASFINPLLGVALAFLPEILGWLMGGNKDAKTEEKLRSVFLGQAFPQIKAKLRPELQKLVGETVQEMIVQVSAEYKAQIDLKKSELEAAIKEKEVGQSDKDQAIARLESVRDAIGVATMTLLTKYA